jgi:hypothetical protein
MELLAGLVTALSKAVISSLISNVGEVVVEGVKKFLSVGVEILEKAITIIDGVAKAAGIIEPDQHAEDIGDRAMRADKKPEDFDSINGYIDYLKKDIEGHTQAELESLPPEERLARKAVGCTVLSKAISEKKSLDIPYDFWETAVKAGLTALEIDTFLTKFKASGLEPEDFNKYLKKELEFSKARKFDNAMVTAYKELEPEMTEEEITEKIIGLKQDG